MTRRQAVSILLTPDPESTQVYLVERNPKLKFFGGYFAFPGGTLDEADQAVKITNAETLPTEILPFLVAAVRETFEETGILLTRAGRSLNAKTREDYRKKLLAERIGFHEILTTENMTIDAGDFTPICKIITPKFSPVRYDTQFLAATIPPDQAPQIWQGELVGGEFYNADHALKQWASGKMLIVPPVIVMLQKLVDRTVQTFTSSVREMAESYLKGKLHRVYFTPGIQLVPLRTRTLPPATHTNTYVVGERQLYLVDPAPSDSGEQERLWDYLDDLVEEGCDLSGILLTHHHSDHVGALRECQSRYNLPLLGHAKTAEKLPNFKFERLLEQGDELGLGDSPDGAPGWKLTVYHTPGHASGHLAFQENRYGAIIAGDLISTISTIVISPPDGHLATYLRSLELLESITEGTLYPSHGPAVRAGKPVVQHYIRHRREREDKLLAALSAKPQSSVDLVKKVYSDVDSRIWPLAEHSLRAGLIKLIEEGKCRQLEDDFVAA